MQRQKRAQRWLREYSTLDTAKATKQELFHAIRRYRPIQMDVKCVLMRLSSSTTKPDLIKTYHSSIRGAKRIANSVN